MNILLVGPIASGKGTQAEKLIEKYKLAHVEMGAILRNIAKEEIPLGRKIKELIEDGKLVTNDIIAEVVDRYLKDIDRFDGILFDGFPRIVSQAEDFEKFMAGKKMKIDLVIYLTLPEGEIYKRLARRRTCKDCGKIFNILTRPPKVEGVCDFCGGGLIIRNDESPKKTAVRIEWFKREVLPMIDLYRKRGIVEEIDGDRPKETIFEDIVERLKKRGLADA